MRRSRAAQHPQSAAQLNPADRAGTTAPIRRATAARRERIARQCPPTSEPRRPIRRVVRRRGCCPWCATRSRSPATTAHPINHRVGRHERRSRSTRLGLGPNRTKRATGRTSLAYEHEPHFPLTDLDRRPSRPSKRVGGRCPRGGLEPHCRTASKEAMLGGRQNEALRAPRLHRRHRRRDEHSVFRRTSRRGVRRRASPATSNPDLGRLTVAGNLAPAGGERVYTAALEPAEAQRQVSLVVALYPVRSESRFAV